MAIILNLIAFAACLIWFHKIMNAPKHKLLIPVVLVYLGSVILSFFIALAVQHDFLDGVIHLMVCAVSILVFWVWTTIIIIIKHNKNGQTKYIGVDLIQTSALLIIPLFILFLVTNLSFKIGG
ncbi:hypothetical protein [Fluviicola sp.]|uniref:hypothetical protein n=1 Tax=Fluviicola sp. TaxID=1917219 RepID=UPI00262B0C8C|nr:hypothetical protein [Fluviicola sp.]